MTLCGAEVAEVAAALERYQQARAELDAAAGAGEFAASREQFEQVVGWLGGQDAAGLEHGELEARLGACGRQLLRRLCQDHLNVRALTEKRRGEVTGADQVTRTRAEAGHSRALATVFGQVTVTRIAYRAPGAGNLHPADAALNLPHE